VPDDPILPSPSPTCKPPATESEVAIADIRSALDASCSQIRELLAAALALAATEGIDIEANALEALHQIEQMREDTHGFLAELDPGELGGIPWTELADGSLWATDGTVLVSSRAGWLPDDVYTGSRRRTVTEVAHLVDLGHLDIEPQYLLGELPNGDLLLGQHNGEGHRIRISGRYAPLFGSGVPYSTGRAGWPVVFLDGSGRVVGVVAIIVSSEDSA